jgi:hypothetical protein
MRGLLMLCLLCAAGCQNITGPFMPREPIRVDDPCLSIQEQESRGRDRWAIPDDTSRMAPKSGNVMTIR